MESRWTDYAGRNRELPGGPASFLVRFSGGEAGTLWSAHSETPRAFRRLEELIFGLEEEMESAGRPAPSPGPPAADGRTAPVWTFRGGEDSRRRGAPRAVTIQVRRRQGGMQGEAQICGSGRRACFRSGWELLALLRSALESWESARPPAERDVLRQNKAL